MASMALEVAPHYPAPTALFLVTGGSRIKATHPVCRAAVGHGLPEDRPPRAVQRTLHALIAVTPLGLVRGAWRALVQQRRPPLVLCARTRFSAHAEAGGGRRGRKRIAGGTHIVLSRGSIIVSGVAGGAAGGGPRGRGALHLVRLRGTRATD